MFAHLLDLFHVHVALNNVCNVLPVPQVHIEILNPGLLFPSNMLMMQFQPPKKQILLQ